MVLVPEAWDLRAKDDAGPAGSASLVGAGIGSASAARPGAAGKGSAKYWVSCVTRPSVISMTLTEYVAPRHR